MCFFKFLFDYSLWIKLIMIYVFENLKVMILSRHTHAHEDL